MRFSTRTALAASFLVAATLGLSVSGMVPAGAATNPQLTASVDDNGPFHLDGTGYSDCKSQGVYVVIAHSDGSVVNYTDGTPIGGLVDTTCGYWDWTIGHRFPGGQIHFDSTSDYSRRELCFTSLYAWAYDYGTGPMDDGQPESLERRGLLSRLRDLCIA